MKTAPAKLLVNVVRATAALERKRRAMERAARRMPKPVSWDWAEPRILPLLSGPVFDEPGEPIVRMPSTAGPAIEFGIDLGPMFARVDAIVAERWERSPDQLLDCGLSNLRRRAERLTSADVSTGVMSGRRIRMLARRPTWASSILLDLPTLVRLFGEQDQYLAACRTDCILSMPIDTPSHAFAEIAIELEDSWNSLFLDPFILESGRLLWEGSLDDDDEAAD